ncbi:MAG: leucine-rich repeat domain-containing protein [Ruminiclostridium sp.]|nr:leucine-rich repeat domain-containing protein [Ruminiclostridium sp.]
MTEEEKEKRLEDAVLSETPEEVTRIYKELGEVEFSGLALGRACAFRGLDMVKALVECGASFRYLGEDENFPVNNWAKIVEGETKVDFSLLLFPKSQLVYNKHHSKEKEYLTVSQLAEVLDYLCGNAEKTGVIPKRLLFYSIMYNYKEYYDVLKKHGVSISEDCQRLFATPYVFMESIKNKNFTELYGLVLKEMNAETIKIDQVLADATFESTVYPECLEFILEHFIGFNKNTILKAIIHNEAISCLAIVEKRGWLNHRKRRDYMMNYALYNEKNESLARLLDFKNRTADLKAEQKAAEKEAERTLNANPNSVRELRKIWKFKKREDNTIIIKAYKGKSSEVVVPEKIGNRVVTALGFSTFEPGFKKLKRNKITKITLPDTIEHIAAFAFFDCKMLTEVNIPETISTIEGLTFNECRSLTEITIPSSVTKIEMWAFLGCTGLKKIVIPNSVTESERGDFQGC